ncbi:unnamed protein product [Rotaria sp. Silwood2]|nr:unnamed protein product [Rotaria sp. Silwood2]CAF2472450.1 unnamed protein product [Rotaria sp. Silwood2]CAF2859601.1 unnamed protein product [Rotaria sp. Silwood2]CAF3850165.1 unnamed protein product [Rotaria sp. Silwood2]CAF4032411.1 unnamed protein product [Rotaria sp. Silwood2]
MTDTKSDDDKNYESDEYSDENSSKSINSFIPIVQDDEENLRRTSSSLNNYMILPPIKSITKDNNSEQQYFIKNLQEKYQQQNNKNDISELGNDAKLDDAYLKMKRLDKALEEAFEKEKQVKIETMSLMKKLRNEMQSMTVALNSDSNDSSHTQLNLKRFLALDDEILKLDGSVIEDENPTESIFKTQLSDPLGDSHNTNKSNRDSINSNTVTSSLNKKKKSSLSSNSTMNTKDKFKKSKIPEKDFIKRNIQLAKELGGTWALTDDEKQRLNQLLNEDDQENVIALANQQYNGYIPSTNDTQRLKEIDDLLEKEYYNPLLNHQLRRNTDTDINYSNIQQITNEEDEQLENPFGEQILKETRLQREHMHRLKKIDEQLEYLHRPKTEEKIEAILSDEQLNELLGQCAVDEMKQRFSFLNHDKQDQKEIDFNDLSDYALTHYVENNQGPLITDEIIQLLIYEAQQEGITMRQLHDENEDDIDSLQKQEVDALVLAPAIDRPLSSTSTASHIDLYNRNLD